MHFRTSDAAALKLCVDISRPNAPSLLKSLMSKPKSLGKGAVHVF